MDGTGRGSRVDARRRPPRRDRAAAAQLRGARGRARPRRRLARLRRGSRRRSRSSRSGSPATSSAARPASGPHLDEIGIKSGDRDLRTFGSQGEQRLAVLALLLAEAELIGERRRVPPLLLLDDALSELDESRRRTLSERIGAMGQTIVTATGSEALPLAPAQLLPRHPRPRRARLMERLDGAVRGALRGAGVPDAGALADVTRLWPAVVGRRDRARGLAAADLPRRHAPRRRGVVDLGVRARPARGRDPRASSPPRSDGRADRDPLRARARSRRRPRRCRSEARRRRPRSTTRPGCWPTSSPPR